MTEILQHMILDEMSRIQFLVRIYTDHKFIVNHFMIGKLQNVTFAIENAS